MESLFSMASFLLSNIGEFFKKYACQGKNIRGLKSFCNKIDPEFFSSVFYELFETPQSFEHKAEMNIDVHKCSRFS